jgi:hypothetical protein
MSEVESRIRRCLQRKARMAVAFALISGETVTLIARASQKAGLLIDHLSDRVYQRYDKMDRELEVP